MPYMDGMGMWQGFSIKIGVPNSVVFSDSPCISRNEAVGSLLADLLQ